MIMTKICHCFNAPENFSKELCMIRTQFGPKFDSHPYTLELNVMPLKICENVLGIISYATT